MSPNTLKPGDILEMRQTLIWIIGDLLKDRQECFNQGDRVIFVGLDDRGRFELMHMSGQKIFCDRGGDASLRFDEYFLKVE